MKILSVTSLILSALFLTGCSLETETSTSANRVLVVVGPSSHAPGSHEVAAGGRLLEYCLENMENVAGFEVDVVYAWSEVSHPLDTYASIVFIGDNFPGEYLSDSENAMKDISAMMERGCGLVCIHYAVGLRDEDVDRDGDHPLLHWMGGYFAARCAHHQSIAKIYPAAKIEAVSPGHPITRGWQSFTLHDEPYINNYFGPDNNQLLPGAFALATSLLPLENPKEEIVAWGIERSDTGRGIGITMPHFSKNWQVEDLRRFILNSIVWTAKREIPQEGVQTALPNLETFGPESVEFVSKKKN